MHEHDLELIAALVEGRLDDETEARALVSSSPEHRAEYQTQKLAYETLRVIGRAHLTDSERSDLHRDVWTGLRDEDAGTPRTPWYYRWVPAAAALLLVAGVAAVFLSGGGGESGEATGLAAENVTTVADAAAQDDTGEGDAGAATVTTAAATATTTREAPDATTDGESLEAPSEDAAPLASDEAIAIYRREAELLRQGVFGERMRAYESTDAAVETCVEQAGLTGHRVLATLSAPMNDTQTSDEEKRIAVAFPEGPQLETAPISFVDLDTCEVVYTDE